MDIVWTGVEIATYLVRGIGIVSDGQRAYKKLNDFDYQNWEKSDYLEAAPLTNRSGI